MTDLEIIFGNTDLKNTEINSREHGFEKIENTELMILFGTVSIRILSLREMCQCKCGLGGIYAVR